LPEPELDPQLYLVIGGTGDLMRRKLLPALFRLLARDPRRAQMQVLAVARNPSLDDRSYRAWARETLLAAGIAPDDPDLSWCNTSLHYHSLGQETPEDFARLSSRLSELEREHNLPGNRVFNLAVPPAALPAVVSGLAAAGLHRGPGWTRLVVEKPFGSDLESARALNALLHQHFDESQIYRIDHYLGKETVQNLLVFRFVNAMFESLWNRDRISRVQIIVSEKIGVDARGSFFDQVGTLRDMVQNHLTQLLALTAMEMPVALDRDNIRDEKVKVLRAIEEITPADAVFGQYTAGEAEGQTLAGYQEEAEKPGSQTETFVALRLFLNNWRWWGVPFYLCTGKRLPERVTQIVVTFRCPTLQCLPPFVCSIECNRLTIAIEPREGFDLQFQVKVPGPEIRMESQRWSFRYADAFGPLRDAYETLLLDVMEGDATFFVRADEVEASWRLYDSLLQHRPPLHPYPAGAWGPREASALMEGEDWHREIEELRS
jgi:glucose-6-phosphate 1-dehydrogenase